MDSIPSCTNSFLYVCSFRMDITRIDTPYTQTTSNSSCELCPYDCTNKLCGKCCFIYSEQNVWRDFSCCDQSRAFYVDTNVVIIEKWRTECGLLYTYIIPHLHNLFLFQYDVTRSLNRCESPEQTVY